MSDNIEKKSHQLISRKLFLSVLNDIIFDALETQDFDELLQRLVDRLAKIIDVDGCFITIWDEETGQTKPGAAYGPLRDVYKKIIMAPGKPTITDAVLEAGKPLVVQDAWNTTFASHRITRQFTAKSILGIPIFQGKKKLGAALFAFNDHRDFLDQEIEYCEQAVRQISLAIANVKNLAALKASEDKYRLAAEALKQRETHLAEAQENAKMGSWENDIQLGNAIWSEGLFRLFDLPINSEVPEDDDLIKLVAKPDRRHFSDTLFAAVEDRKLAPLEFKTIHGRHLVGEIFLDSKLNKIAGTFQDVTEQRQLQAELFQARKLESIGILAGGIAHNFNNILTVIMGNYEILRASPLAGSSERKVLDQCLAAVDRAALLTRQLLVVSQKHELSPAAINLNSLITELVNLLQPLIGGHISITTTLSPELSMVYADPSHLQQVIMNLTLNARDALESGGKLNIHTESIQKDGCNWSAVTVKDSGTGIDSANLPHIFEPFFTTKDEGKGTGLGLATVASIVEQSHGRIEVESQLGKGTSITLYLPAREHLQESTTAIRSLAIPQNRPATNVVLLVEDHESLRNIAQFVLEKAGYKILTAADGVQAKRLFADNPHPDLLLTDIQLPHGISGIQLADELRAELNDLPIIFMSGLRDDISKFGDATFLPKPFRPHELVAAVEKALL